MAAGTAAVVTCIGGAAAFLAAPLCRPRPQAHRPRAAEPQTSGGSSASRAPALASGEVKTLTGISKGAVSEQKAESGALYINIVGGLLLIGRGPGQAEDSILLTGAHIVASASSVVVTPRLSPPVTLWVGSPEEAEVLAKRLSAAAAGVPAPAAGGSAARAVAPLQLDAAVSAPAVAHAAASPTREQRTHNVRIAELEARVAATLHAAVERARRIRELEAAVQDNKVKDARIQELGLLVDSASRQSMRRAERILELEASISTAGEQTLDPEAQELFEDSMRFAEQMLLDREDLALDGDSTLRLRQVVQSVKETRPVVNKQVADLISRLVSALRWPLALQRRLADAEDTVRELRMLQDTTRGELRHLQEHQALQDTQAAEELQSLQEQLAQTEQQSAKAEVSAMQLRAALQDAEQAADAALAQQRAILEETHAEDLQKLRELSAAVEEQRGQAELEANELRRELVAVESRAEEAQHQLDAKLAVQLDRLKAEQDEADSARREAANEAERLREAVAVAQAETADRNEQMQELQCLRVRNLEIESRRQQSENDARELRRMLEEARRSTNSIIQPKEELDKKRDDELESIRRRNLVAEEELRAADAKRRKALEDAWPVDEELARLRTRHLGAEVRSQKAEEQAREMAERLARAERTASEAVIHERRVLDTQHQDELRRVRERHRQSELAVDEVEMRASEFRERLVNAEAATEATDGPHFLTDRAESPAAATAPEPAMDEHFRRLAETAFGLVSQAPGSAVGSTAREQGPASAFEDLEQRLAAAERAVVELGKASGPPPAAASSLPRPAALEPLGSARLPRRSLTAVSSATTSRAQAAAAQPRSSRPPPRPPGGGA